MLYYLAITAEIIRESKNNRLILDDIYTSLLNDINPGAIDETTQDHLANLRDIINSYMTLSKKRDRLQYIYNQDKAAAMRSAVPNPLAILSMTNALDWKALAASALYTVVDSYNNYKQASEAADREYLMSGWELDEEEEETIRKNRDRAFDYMVDIVQEYSIDGNQTLNEKAITKFAEICNIENVAEKTRRLESEEKTYKLLGDYWLQLGDCYYETGKYERCLECVDRYNELSTGIYRQDSDYVQILPKAIVSAQNIYQGDEYVSVIDKFTNDIVDNTSKEEWSTLYFAAQVYLDLYSKTNSQDYLRKAYDLAYDNMTVLLEEQRTINKTYLNDVKNVEAEEPDYRFLNEKEKKEKEKEYKAEKERVKEYNKSLKEKRKTELPSLYEPLILNCDLVFALAEKLDISDSEKADIEAILETESNGIFLSKPVNDRYSFLVDKNDYNIEFGTEEIVIPADLLSDGSSIVVTVSEGNDQVTIDDIIIKKVERKDSKIESFLTHISSKKLRKYKWTEESNVKIEIFNDERYDPLVLQYRVKSIEKKKLLADKVVFEEV